MTEGSRQPELEAVVLQAELKLRSIMEAALDAIVVADMSGNIISWNPGAEAIFAYSETEVQGKPLTILMPERYRAAHLRGLERLRETGERQRVGRTSELNAVRKDGQEFPIEISLGTWVTGEGRFFCGIIRDITQRKALEEALRHAALHDALSNLPNRVYFSGQLERAAARAARQRSLTAVMMVDLDNFKAVNDRFGHQTGDGLLKAWGARLRTCVRAADTVARFGGDEFGVLMEDLTAMNDAGAAAGRIVADMLRPFSLERYEITSSASVGVAVRRGAFGPEDILREADRALYLAKGKGKARFELTPP